MILDHIMLLQLYFSKIEVLNILITEYMAVTFCLKNDTLLFSSILPLYALQADYKADNTTYM